MWDSFHMIIVSSEFHKACEFHMKFTINSLFRNGTLNDCVWSDFTVFRKLEINKERLTCMDLHGIWGSRILGLFDVSLNHHCVYTPPLEGSQGLEELQVSGAIIFLWPVAFIGQILGYYDNISLEKENNKKIAWIYRTFPRVGIFNNKMLKKNKENENKKSCICLLVVCIGIDVCIFHF